MDKCPKCGSERGCIVTGQAVYEQLTEWNGDVSAIHGLSIEPSYEHTPNKTAKCLDCGKRIPVAMLTKESTDESLYPSKT